MTGNIGSGKTTVGKLFSLRGIPVYHADNRAKELMDDPLVVRKVAQEFGHELVGEDGLILKQKLAAIVFPNQQLLSRLNALIHPLVRADFEQWVMVHDSSPYVLQEAAILFESGFSHLFQRIVLVTAPDDLRIKRVCDRDNVSLEQVKQRDQRQMPQEKKIPLADFVVINDGMHLLDVQVESIHGTLLALSDEWGQAGL